MTTTKPAAAKTTATKTAATPVLAETPRTLIGDLAAAMAAASAVTKSSRNTDQNYDYASAEQILAAVRGPLLERGLVLTQQTVDLQLHEITSRNGARGTSAIVTVDFTFHHGPSDQELPIRGWRGCGQDYGDKAIQKAYTNAVKTFIRSQWLLPTETDDPHAPAPEAAVAALPSWAMNARDERRVQLADALTPVTGREAAFAVIKSVEQSLGCVPDVLVPFARLLSPQPPTAPAAVPSPPAAGAPGDEPDEPAVHPDQEALEVA